MKKLKLSFFAVFFAFAQAGLGLAGEQETATELDAVVASKNSAPVQASRSSSAAFSLNWLSINGGGAINASSTNYKLGLSVGQSVAGAASSPSYQMGIGFWYGASASPACAAIKGDMNADNNLAPNDVVLMLTCVFLGTGSCDLCFADLNCDSGLTPTDVVIHLNMVFLGSPAGC